MTREELEQKARKMHVPEHLIEGLVMYVLERRRQGSFLMAVLRNDLRLAVAHADDIALENLKHVVGFVYWEVPGLCAGSPEAVDAWLRGEGE